ncbi:hypothetical protein LPJ72_002868 [Coemansia sp. Benny D160-2]|nr:hypothetical protein LPJ72_002868 [Coemansia sp. Benny D160-2]
MRSGLIRSSQINQVLFFQARGLSSGRICSEQEQPDGIPSGWNATIGLELHVQLMAKKKLFSPASAKWDDPPNTNVALVDAGVPGSLPLLNPECMQLAARAIIGLDGKVQNQSSFDRKHYFYSDQPLGFQITQQHSPIGRGGKIHLGTNEGLKYTKDIRISQMQLEQDTAKSIHAVYPGYVLTDLNRAGVALLEIVSEPDIDTPDEAALCVRKIQTLLRHIGASHCNMEEGSMRCDVNVSVYRDGECRLSGTRCELKNLNSLKVIRGAINAEVQRQIEVIHNGKQVEQETRGFDARQGKTFLARSKEDAPDYRYMPEPDIPEVHLTDQWIEAVRATLPELPEAALARIQGQYSLSKDTVETMLDEPGCIGLFEDVAKGRNAKVVAAWITSEVFGQLSYRAQRVQDSTLTANQLSALLDALEGKMVTSTQAKQLLVEYMNGDVRSVADLIKAHGWEVISDEGKLVDIAKSILDEHPKEIEGYLKGQKRRLNFFVGKVMSATKGQARPQDVSRIVHELLEKRR